MAKLSCILKNHLQSYQFYPSHYRNWLSTTTNYHFVYPFFNNLLSISIIGNRIFDNGKRPNGTLNHVSLQILRTSQLKASSFKIKQLWKSRIRWNHYQRRIFSCQASHARRGYVAIDLWEPYLYCWKTVNFDLNYYFHNHWSANVRTKTP